jgi:hypothetical protein
MRQEPNLLIVHEPPLSKIPVNHLLHCNAAHPINLIISSNKKKNSDLLSLAINPKPILLQHPGPVIHALVFQHCMKALAKSN